MSLLGGIWKKIQTKTGEYNETEAESEIQRKN